MKIKIESIEAQEEEEIIIRSNHIDEKILSLIQTIKNQREKLSGVLQDGSIKLLNPEDILYFESVDNKVFAYTFDQVYEIKLKLYEIEEKFQHTDLVRISKSMILNLSKASKFIPSFGSRIEVLLINQEKVIISRQYVSNVKKILGI